MATDAEGRSVHQRRQVTREEALEYHSREPQGKVQVVPTKPTGSQRDLSLAVVGVGAALIALVLAFVPQVFGTIDSLGQRAIAAVLVVIFAFFFVTVSSRIVGLVGVTSNPTSGMTRWR